MFRKAPFDINQLKEEYIKLEKSLPEALKWKEWALLQRVKQQKTQDETPNYDCLCGKERIEYCSNFACVYSRIRENEHIDGPISYANWIENRMIEIKVVLNKL